MIITQVGISQIKSIASLSPTSTNNSKKYKISSYVKE